MTFEPGVELFLEMVPPTNLLLTQIPIPIFLGRWSEFFSFLKNTAVFLQLKTFLFPLSEEGVLPVNAHGLIKALVQSPEMCFW